MTSARTRFSWLGLVSLLAIVCWSATTSAQAVRDSGIVQVRPPTSVEAQLGSANPLPGDDAAWQRSIATHVALMSRSPLASKVVSDPNSLVVKTKWYAKFNQPSEAASWLSQHLHIAQIPGTALIEVWIDPQEIDGREAAMIVMNLVNQYIEDMKKISSDSLLNRKNALQQLQSRHETQARQARQNTSRAQGELQMDSTGKPNAIVMKEQELFQLISERLKVNAQVDEATTALETAKARVQAGNTPASVSQSVDQHPQVSYWRQYIDQLDVQIRTLPQGDSSPQYRQLADTRKAAQDKLDAIRKEQTSNLMVAYLDQLQGRVVAAQHQLESIGKNIENLRLDVSDLSFQLANYVRQNDEMIAFQQLARREREELDRLNTAINALDMNSIAWAVQPGGQFKP